MRCGTAANSPGGIFWYSPNRQRANRHYGPQPESGASGMVRFFIVLILLIAAGFGAVL
jgi:hypothetical protein